MTEDEWTNCTDPNAMLDFLRSHKGETRRKAGRRKWRLFACACLRGIWPLLRKPDSRNAVEVAERFADGLANAQELATAYSAARGAFAREYARFGPGQSWQSAEAAVHVGASRFSGGDHASVAHAAGSAALAWALSRVGPGRGADHSRQVRQEKNLRHAFHADLLRDIYGNPYRPAAFDPSLLSWNQGTIPKLAQAIYEEREMPVGTLDNARLALLADALEDAGSDNGEVLRHLRQQGRVHVRGCWCIDLLLNKA
jgi:hypothetical protein